MSKILQGFIQPFLSLESAQFFVLVILILVLAGVFSIAPRYVRSFVQYWRLRQTRRRPLRSKVPRESYDATEFATDEEWLSGSGQIVIESIDIHDFKSIEELKLDFSGQSELSGYWACIAGINGAGKSSILQAICLVLLGNELATDLGRGRISRMSRQASSTTYQAYLTAIVRQGENRRELVLPFSEIGIDENQLRDHPRFTSMQLTWKKLRAQLLVSYGATRNLSAEKSRRSDLLPLVQQQLSLFDPLSEIASAETLLSGSERSRAALTTLQRLLPIILGPDNVRAERFRKNTPILFEQNDAKVEAIDLPDGFRSTVAWLAGLCAEWHEVARRQDQKVSTDPALISGIVLIDEIGLHLHPELERAIVPRLRKALPLVQFIVTTHSPMVLASFDRTELKVLDSKSETGLRPALDRQIFGFSMDDVYEYLMGTSPASTVVEELLREGTSEKLATYLYQSKDVNEEQARETLIKREELLQRLDEKKKEKI